MLYVTARVAAIARSEVAVVACFGALLHAVAALFAGSVGHGALEARLELTHVVASVARLDAAVVALLVGAELAIATGGHDAGSIPALAAFAAARDGDGAAASALA